MTTQPVDDRETTDQRTQADDLVERLGDEADLCRNDDANDIADLLDEAAAYIKELTAEVERLKESEWQYHVDCNEAIIDAKAAEARAAKAEEAEGRLRKLLDDAPELGDYGTKRQIAELAGVGRSFVDAWRNWKASAAKALGEGKA